MSSKSHGTVKWFDNSKSYGFIVNESGQDVFLHHSEIQTDGYRRARDGDGVKYVEISTDNGLKATEVEVYENNWPFEQDFKKRKLSASELG